MDIKNCRSSALFTDISSGGSKQFVFHANDYILFRFLVINVSKILLQMGLSQIIILKRHREGVLRRDAE